MDTLNMAAGSVPAEAPADGALPAGGDAPAGREERPASRRKVVVLLLLLLVLLVLLLVSAWYLMFRKPLTQMVPGVIAPQAMPTYQGSLYKLTMPQAVAVSSDGTRIVVTETGTSRDTVMMDLQGNKLGVLAPPATKVADPSQMFVALDPATGEFWTSDRRNGTVAVYDASGKFVRLFDPGSSLTGWQPLALGFDKTGDLFVADVSTGPGLIHEFGTDGKEIRTFGASSSLSSPNGIAVGADGTVYVADTGNGRLVIFDATGNPVATVARGASEANLGLPAGVAIDDKGLVLVADSSGSRVQAYQQLTTGQTSPDYVNAFGENGSGNAAFSFPNGIAADARGRVFVADWGNDRLEVWSY